MKPPRKPGSSSVGRRDRVSSKTKKPKRLCYHSPRQTSATGKENGTTCSYIKASPRNLLSPSFDLSFGSDMNDELLACVDKIDLVCSTPMGPVCKNCSHRDLNNAALSSKSLLFDLSSSQVQESMSHCVSTTSAPGLASFMTTPSKDCQEHLKLSQWGIPDLVLEQYSRRGIKSMYKWQAECLMQPVILQGGNLVFSAPTSAGKTFIAELLALKCVLETKKKVVIILPFVSIAHEKANYLQSIFEPNGVKVGGFMGGHSPSGGFAAVDIAICTIEKANSLVNRLLEEGNISELGAVVVDELHMIGDSHRGYLLELLLTKLLYVCKSSRVSKQDCSVSTGEVAKRNGIQIIGMSATLPNLDMLSKWLEGQLYCTDYRPVPLQEMVKVGTTLFDTKFEKIRDLHVHASESATDEEDIVKLCEETVTSGHSVLIFCPTKQWCENLAGVIATAPFLGRNSGPSMCTEDGGVVQKAGEVKSSLVLDSVALNNVMEQLRRTQVGLDGILGKTVPSGVGFHHAGLTFEEREIVEGAFRQGLIRVLVATSTLSSGVNLPARLVIVRTPFFQRSLLDVLVYKQMVGRAGRKGVDERGESVLICKPSERSKVSNLFQSAPKAVTSCLDQRQGQRGKANNMSALRRALLEVITSGTATTQVEVETYVKCTLLFAEMKRSAMTSPSKDPSTVTKKLVCSTAEYLLANEFIQMRNPLQDVPMSPCDGSKYHATQLGAATVASALSPEEALVVFGELRKAQRNFVLESELHIIYLVTPVYIQEQWPTIDWYRFLCLLERLPADMRHVANTLGIQESFLASAIQGRIPERTTAQQERLRIYRRFFTALALHDLVHEVPIVYVARKYSVSKGLLQTLQSAAGTFAGMVTVFCNRLGWKNLELLLSQFQSRLSFGIERELCDLVRISLLNGFRARALYNAGFHTLSALATANPLAIERCLRNAVPFRSSKAVEGGKEEETVHRNSTTWCAKLRRGMTEFEAAHQIVHEAQKILSDQMNMPLNAWKLIQQTADVKAVAHSPMCMVESKHETSASRKLVRKSPNVQVTNHTKRPCLAKLLPKGTDTSDRGTCCTETNGLGTHTCKNFKTPVQRKSRKTSSVITDISSPASKVPLSTSSKRVAPPNKSDLQMQSTPHSEKQTVHPLHLPCMDTGRDDSISYSPIFSPNVSVPFQHSQSRSLLNAPLPVESFELSSPTVVPLAQGEKVADVSTSNMTSSGDCLLTVPNSLPCSMDMSSSFSCATFAMIDAVCDGEGLTVESGPPPQQGDMSCSLLSGAGEMEERQNDMEIMKVAESPTLDANTSRPTNSRTDEGVGQPLVYSPKLQHFSAVEKSNHQANVSVIQSHAIPATSAAVAQSNLEPSQSRLKDLSLTSSSQVSLSQSGTCIIDVTSNTLLFQTFISECLEQASFSFSIALSKSSCDGAIGSKIVEPKTALGIPIPHQNEQVVGVAICWGDMDVYYLSLSKPAPGQGEEVIPLASKVEALHSIFASKQCREVMAYSIKRHVKILTSVFGIIPTVPSLDPQVADWMLNPDGKEKTIHKMVLHYLPDQPLLSEGEDYEEMPLSTLATHATEPHIQAAAEALLASLLVSKTRTLLKEEGLYKSFLEVEMPSLIVLTKMELNGIGFSKDECDALKQTLQLRLSQLETEAYSLARRSFSLTSPEDVAKVLFVELQLPAPSDHKQQKTLGPNRRGKKRLQHLSTAKEVLEKMKSLHPLPGLVLEWRRVSSTVTKTVFPLFKDAVCHEVLKSIRIHATCHIHTATGRVATSDPNLQMVPKQYDIGSQTTGVNFKDSDACKLLSESQCFRDACDNEPEDNENCVSELQSSRFSVNMRSVFVPFPGAVFLAADYSQLELRILAHMSGDTKLQKVLNSEGDVFKMIAGEWLGIPALQVTAEERQNAKQICYGMVYGIGPKALGEQLKISQDDAAQFMETFKSKYPVMRRFISTTLQSCRDNGYIVTLLGRKRFLSGIHSQNVHIRSQAERQAVNSTVQGSAADLVKTAMVNIDRVLAEEYKMSPQCLTLPESQAGQEGDKPRNAEAVRGAFLVLQLHDELLYEVCEKDLPRVAEIVQYQMENALQLSVKFPVKMQTGSSWGNLRPYIPQST